jgi:hypothetical protein
MELNSVLVSALVTFLTHDDGGRTHPACDSNKYRPHLVVGDPAQRTAVLGGDDGRTLIEPHLMTCFTGDGEELVQGIPHEVAINVSYCADIEGYEAPVSGSTFTIREGAKIVGYGEVLSISGKY